jgi:serine/threonine protein kinase
MTTTTPQMPLLLGRYRPLGLIARGGMSSLFRAHDERLDREVAVKIFSSSSASDLEAHHIEVRSLAALNTHHGIVSIVDAGLDDSTPGDPRPIVVMELVPGESLASALTHRSLSRRAIAEIAYDLSECLEYVHAHGIIHRDITPANVMLVDYGTSIARARARLTDFGIALDLDAARRETVTGTTTGTAAYLSPERVRQEPLTPASDIYSLGLVLLECFTGTPAFPMKDQTVSLSARLAEDPAIPSDLPDNWSALLRDMTARSPAERPTAVELTPAFRQAVIDTSGRRRAGED